MKRTRFAKESRKGQNHIRGAPGRRARKVQAVPVPRVLVEGNAVGPARNQRVPPKWAWHYRTLLRLRERLLQERSEKLRNTAEPLEPHSLSIADTGTDEFDHDMVLSQLSTGQDLLYEVEEALKCILDGSYGMCQETGRPIPTNRLRALPWTRFTKAVETRLENKGVIRKTGLGRLGSTRGEASGNLEGSDLEEETQPPVPKDESLRVITPPSVQAQLRRAVSRHQKHRSSIRTRSRQVRSRRRR